MNVLQACIDKPAKPGLFLKSFVTTSAVYFKIIMLFCKVLKNLVFKSENKHQQIEFDKMWAYNWFLKSACFYRLVNTGM